MNKKKLYLSCAAGFALAAVAAFFVAHALRNDMADKGASARNTVAAGKLPTQIAVPQPQATIEKTTKSLTKTSVQQSVVSTVQTGPRRKMDIDLAQLAADYDDLRSRAEAGDSKAAMALFDGLSNCVGTPLTRARLEDSKRSTAAALGANSPDYASAAAFQEKRYQDCLTIGEDKFNDARKWLILAAEQGDSRARLAFANIGPPRSSETPFADFLEYSAKAQQYVDDELRANNPKAFYAASNSYAPGGFNEKDAVKQYTYLYAYALATDLEQGVVFDRMVNLGDSLSSLDRARAIAQAQTLYAACCSR